jgi:acetyl esterase
MRGHWHLPGGSAPRERWRLGSRIARFLLGAPDPLLRLVAGRDPVVIDDRVLNLRVQAILAVGNLAGRGRRRTAPDVASARRELERLAPLGMPERTGVHVEGRRLPGPGGELPVRIYRRTGSGAGQPAVVYFHGGGWATGSLDTHDASCRLIADEGGCTVVSVGYRLAPEHTYPAALDDAVAAYRFVLDNAEDLAVDVHRVGVMGDSAGASLAASLTLAALGQGLPRPFAQCLVYPSVDFAFDTGSCRTMGHGSWLSLAEMEWFRSLYMPDPSTWSSPLASPGRARDLSVFPHTLIYAAGFDPLRDDATGFALALGDAGVPVRMRCYDDQIHGFFGMGVIDEAMKAAVEICRDMGEAMHRSPPLNQA